MAKEWYIIHTYSGHENKVKFAIEREAERQQLLDQIYQVKIPTEEIVENKGGKKKVKSRKIFPSYVLVEMELNDKTRTLIRRVPGVTNFVGAFGTSEPKPLSRDEVSALFDQMGEQKVREKTSVVVDFSVGEHIKVVDGPFSNFTGVVEEVFPDKGRLRVKVEIFGRGTPVELDFLQVGKI